VVEDLSKGGKGVVGVGSKLVEELFNIPLNLDPELVRTSLFLQLSGTEKK
jgi:hypothetical protein